MNASSGLGTSPAVNPGGRGHDPNADSDDAAYVSNEDGGCHTKWLNYMRPRLWLTWELLSDDGVCFMSINDAELFPLGFLLDEIFDEAGGVLPPPLMPRPEGDSEESVYWETIVCDPDTYRLRPLVPQRTNALPWCRALRRECLVCGLRRRRGHRVLVPTARPRASRRAVRGFCPSPAGLRSAKVLQPPRRRGDRRRDVCDLLAQAQRSPL